MLQLGYLAVNQFQLWMKTFQTQQKSGETSFFPFQSWFAWLILALNFLPAGKQAENVEQCSHHHHI